MPAVLILTSALAAAYAMTVRPWATMLDDALDRVGSRPIVIARALFLLGVFVSTVLHALGRLQLRGMSDPSLATVFSQTMVPFFLAASAAVIVFEVVVVPIAAVVVRRGHADLPTATALVLMGWLLAALVVGPSSAALWLLPAGSLFAFGLVAALRLDRRAGGQERAGADRDRPERARSRP